MAFFVHPFQEGGNLQIISGSYTVPEKHPYSSYLTSILKRLFTVECALLCSFCAFCAFPCVPAADMCFFYSPEKRKDIKGVFEMLDVRLAPVCRVHVDSFSGSMQQWEAALKAGTQNTTKLKSSKSHKDKSVKKPEVKAEVSLLRCANIVLIHCNCAVGSALQVKVDSRPKAAATPAAGPAGA